MFRLANHHQGASLCFAKVMFIKIVS